MTRRIPDRSRQSSRSPRRRWPSPASPAATSRASRRRCRRLPTAAGVYALNGAPAGAPTALHVFSGTLLPADASFVFDVAFDIDGAGNPVHSSAARRRERARVDAHRRLAEGDERSSTRRQRAPKSGYHADTALVTSLNQVVARPELRPERLRHFAHRQHDLREARRDGGRPRREAAHVRYTVDPNCGFLLVRGRRSEGLIRARPPSAPRADRSAPRRHAPSWRARRARPDHRPRERRSSASAAS